jgi:hypothetical protein
MSLGRWGELGGVVEGVGTGGVSNMLSPVSNGALSSDNGLDVKAKHGEHSKASVLDLLNLELSKGVGVVRKAQRVEGATWVQGVKALNTWSLTSSAEGLSLGHDDHLEGKDGQDRLGVDQVGVAKVVKTALCEDLRTSLEPHGLWEGNSTGSQDLGGDAPKSSEHGPAGMDDLGLAVTSEGLCKWGNKRVSKGSYETEMQYAEDSWQYKVEKICVVDQRQYNGKQCLTSGSADRPEVSQP